MRRGVPCGDEWIEGGKYESGAIVGRGVNPKYLDRINYFESDSKPGFNRLPGCNPYIGPELPKRWQSTLHFSLDH